MAGFKIIHNSYSSEYREPFGAVSENQKITLKLTIETSTKEALKEIKLLTWRDGKLPTENEMKLDEEIGKRMVFSSTFNAPENATLLWYCFRISADGNNFFYGNNEGCFGGLGHVYIFDPKPYQITVYKEGFKTPDWFKNASMYQIFVDRFRKGKDKILDVKPNSFIYSTWEDKPRYVKDEKGHIARWDFFGGNLPGVMEKLNYLVDMGISVIYFNPIFKARSNHKYDTGDYMEIDSMFGDEEYFKKLCEEAEKKGIKIILDGVFSHTGADSKYFNRFGTYEDMGAFQSASSKYYSWYKFKGSPYEYESWWGILDLPNVDEDNKTYRDFIYGNEDSVIRHWQKAGVSGWRLDVADELPDSFIEELRNVVKEKNSEKILIGEVWEDATNKVSYDIRRRYLLGDGLDTVMNYPYRNYMISYLNGKIDSSGLFRRIMQIKENYPKESFYTLMNMTGTHDSERLLTLLGDAPSSENMNDFEKEEFKLDGRSKETAIKRLRQYIAFISTIPGVPSIYYGDETGMEGFKDPLNRGTYPWGKENKDIQGWTKSAMKLRKTHPSLRTGEMELFYTEKGLFGIKRSTLNGLDAFNKKAIEEEFIIIFNNDRVDSKKFYINECQPHDGILIGDGVYSDMITGVLVDFKAGGHINIQPHGVVILKKINKLEVEDKKPRVSRKKAEK